MLHSSPYFITLITLSRFNPESDTPVYHLSNLPNPTALLSNLIERDISPAAIITNRVSASSELEIPL